MEHHDGARTNRRLNTRDKGSSLEHYAGRASSAFYPLPSSTKPLTTLEAFVQPARISPHAAQYWKDQLAGISMHEIESIVDQVPAAEMSDLARQFAVRLMEINRDRILNL
jgi:hypothetical protein